MSAKIYQHWKLDIDQDAILWLTIDRHNATVNSLNREVVSELEQILDDLTQNNLIKALILRSGKTSGFVAGADIEQFLKLETEEQAFDLVRQAQKVFDKLEALSIPTIAMIDGFCLGGGLELVLACDHRIAEDSVKTQLGAPEVKLGLHPGFGGTVRLPRLIGVWHAMRMNLSGHSVSPKQAAQQGLVDVAVPKRDLERAARQYALHKTPRHRPSFWLRSLEHPLIRPWVTRRLHKKLAAKVNQAHYPAPFAILDNWQKNGSYGKEAMIQEAKSIARLLLTDTSRNLVRVFFLQTRLKSLGKGARFPKQPIHVIGAGVMGGDIAAWSALHGFQVTLQDQTQEQIAPAMKRAGNLFAKKSNSELAKSAWDRLIPDLSGAGIDKAGTIIEAISENLSAKQTLYASLESRIKPETWIATNTSSLTLHQLTEHTQKPERLIAIHFFNPVTKMPLVEVAYTEQTDPTVIAQAFALVRNLDRLPLPVKSTPGFLVNRILMPYLLEAMYLLEEGTLAEQIDEAATAFGMPVGPIELADRVGLDTCLAAAQTLTALTKNTIPEKLQQKVAQKQLGQKSGQGFYAWTSDHPTKATSSIFQDKNITNRLIFSLLNEAVACWQEKLVEDADLVDAGMIFGAGFPPFRGGPIHYARSLGLSKVLEYFHTLEQQYGQRFQPHGGWQSLLG